MLECVTQIFVSTMSPPQKTQMRQTFVFVGAHQCSNQIQNATIRDLISVNIAYFDKSCVWMLEVLALAYI